MRKNALPIWSRKLHRWGALVVAAPFLVVLLSGLLLQWKKEVAWVQPPEQRGTGTVPVVSFERILAAVRTVPEAGVAGWADVDRLDVRPGKGVAKVQAVNGWEVQVDLTTGAVLQAAYRRSDLIETLHDGSFFHDAAKHWVFFPTALVVLGLYLTGLYLFYLPHGTRWARRKAGPPGGDGAAARRPARPARAPAGWEPPG
jgi:uncharacterized iron-regulated membrane protein